MKKSLHKGRLVSLCLCFLCVLVVLLFLFHQSARPSLSSQYRLQDETISAFQNGHLLWQRQLPEVNRQFPSSLLAQGKTLYVAAGPVYALDQHTGKLLWQQTILFASAFSTSHQVADALYWDRDHLFAETTYNHLVALDPENGALVWEYAAQDGLIGIPPNLGSRRREIWYNRNRRVLWANLNRPTAKNSSSKQ